MKKSIKILSLVLALALICGALVIGVFAKTAAEFNGVEGVTVMEACDFENADTTIDVKGTDGTANKTTTVGSMGADIINRHGRFQVVSAKYEENIYVTFTPGYVQKSNGGPFISNGYASATTANIFEKSGMLNNRYQVMDFDIYFPAGRSIYYVNPAWQIRYLNASGNSGSNASGTNERGNIGFIIYSDDTADSGIYIQDNNVANWGQNTVKVPLSATEWNHVTYIIEMTDAWALADGTACAEGDEGAIAVLEFTGYIIVNDVIASKYTYGNSISFLGYNDASKFQSGDIRDMVFTEWRTGFQDNSTKTYNKDAVIAFDNMSWRSINTGKYAKTAELQAALGTGVGGSLATWTDSIYDEATMPFGTLAASIGEKNYDSFAAAIADAEAGETVTLHTNIVENYVINKAITVAKNGYTANLTNDNVKMTETDEAYVFEATSIKMTVRVEECKCGNKCIEAKTITVYEGANIWDAIVAAYGFEPTCSYAEGDIQHKFDGFTVAGTAAALFEGGKLNNTAVVDASFANKVAKLSVAYKTVAPTAKLYEADGTTLVKNYFADTDMSAILTAADTKAGRVIVLLADYNTEATKYTSNTVTLDLNGYTIKHLSAPEATSKSGSPLVQVKGTLTIKSSQVGGKIFEAACYKTSNRFSQPFVTCAAAGATINYIGRNESGETTLSFYGANAVQSYGSRGSVNVDGGYYCRNRGDNFALFDMRVLSDCTFKNATMDGQAGTIFAFCARNSGMGTTTATVTIDNCDLINGTVLSYASDRTTVTFTNCVIGGNVVPVNETSSTNPDFTTPMTGDEVYIGKGCMLKKGITTNDNVNVGSTADIAETKTYTLMKNDWTVGADNFALTEKTITVDIDKIVAEKINVILIDGDAEYPVEAVAGMNATVFIGEVAGTQGMVNYSKVVPVPADAKDGDKIEIPENAEITYSAGKVKIQFSMTMTAHFSYNFFVPAVEGIEYVKLNHNLPGYGTDRPFKNSAGNYSSVRKDAEGNTWYMVQTWPGAYRMDSEGTIVVAYEYMGTALTYTTKAFGGMNYAEYILDNENNPVAMKNAVADMIGYTYAFDAARGNAASDAYTALYNKAKAYMTEAEISADASNKDALAKMAEDGYISEIALVAALEGATTTIKMSENATKEGYAVKMYNAGITEMRWWTNGSAYYMHNVRSYAFNEVITVEVYAKDDYTLSNDILKLNTKTEEVEVEGEDGTVTTEKVTVYPTPVATYEWTLAGYINDHAGDKNIDLAKAIYNYAVSADAYLKWMEDNGIKVNY